MSVRVGVLVVFAACSSSTPNDFTKNVHEDEALRIDDYRDAAFALTVDPAFMCGECFFNLTPTSGGCTANYYVPADGGIDLELRTTPLSCGATAWVCGRPYACPCPFEFKKVELGPEGPRWFERAWRDFSKR